MSEMATTMSNNTKAADNSSEVRTVFVLFIHNKRIMIET